MVIRLLFPPMVVLLCGSILIWLFATLSCKRAYGLWAVFDIVVNYCVKRVKKVFADCMLILSCA